MTKQVDKKVADEQANTVAKETKKSVPSKPSSKVSYIGARNYERQGGFTQWLRQRNVFGYVHSVREIPDSFPSKISATISVPQGDGLNRDWEVFQVVVGDYDTRSFFEGYKSAVEDDQANVTVRFTVTNLKSKHFIVEDGEEKGKIVDCWSCTLTHLSQMSINGNVVYKPEERIAIHPNDFYSDNKG